jgi:hypothetical protein
MKKAARSKMERTANKTEEQVKVPSSYLAAALRSSDNVKGRSLFAIPKTLIDVIARRKLPDGTPIH